MEGTSTQKVVIDSISHDQNQLELGFDKPPNFSVNLDPDSQSPDHDLASTEQQQSLVEEKLRALNSEHEEREDKVEKDENIVRKGNANDKGNDNDVVDYAENHVVEDNVKETSEILSIDHVGGDDDVKEEENVEIESKDGMSDDVKETSEILSIDHVGGDDDVKEEENVEIESKDGMSDDVKESEDDKHELNDNREGGHGDADTKMQRREEDGLVDDVKEIGDGNHGWSDCNEDCDVGLEKKKEEKEIKDKWGEDVANLSGNDNEDGWGDYCMDKDGLEKSGDDKKINEDYNGWNDNYIDDEVVKKSENHNYDGWGDFNNVDDGFSKSGNANNNEWDDWKAGVNENIRKNLTLTVVDEDSRELQYPVRSDAEDCSFYLRTGTCKYGSNCKFNHPSMKKHQNQNMKEKVTTAREEYSENPGMIECKYYLSSGGCKFGNACRYNHSRGNPTIAPVQDLNFVGLPIRPGEKECSYYLRTGSCKYAASCRFNHPNPTSGPDPSSGYVNSASHSFKDVSHPTVSSRSLSRAVNETAPYVPLMFPPTQGISSQNIEWNRVQTPTYPPDPHMRSSTTYVTNNSATESNVYAHHQQHMLVEDFPERPGQPECSFFLKTGDCKYRSNCKFHHPKDRTLKLAPFAVTDNGLPLRPDQIICTHYSRYGICKFGPNCRFDHPTNIWNPVSSAGN